MNKNIIRKRKLFSYAIIFLCGAICFFIAVARCAFKIEKNYLENLQENLADVSHQNSEALKGQMLLKQELLESIAMRFDLEPDIREENLYMFEPVAKAFDLKRIGFCDETGMGYATQGIGRNLSYRDFFQHSIRGEKYVSDILKDAMDDNQENVTVMSMPIHDKDGRINGICAITCKTDTLSNELSINTFEGNGKTFVFTETGNVSSTSDSSIVDLFDNLYDLLWAYNGVHFDSKWEMVHKMIQGGEEGKIEHGRGELALKGNNYLYHIEPISLMDGNQIWYLMSLVPETYLQQRFHSTRNNLIKMIFFISLFSLTTFGLVQFLSLRQWKDSRNAAYNSPLTGGPNLSHMLKILERNPIQNRFMVAMRIENFKHTRLALGNKKIENLLKGIWEILASEEKSQDFFCHDKDDSFLLFMDLPSEVELKKRLLKIQMLIREETVSKEHVAWIIPKFGVTKIETLEKPLEAVRKAELAVHYALENEHSYVFYDEDKQNQQIEIQNYEDHFKQALKNREFLIYFQPKYSEHEKKLTGCEALVRWSFKNERMVYPDKFIPLLERNGKINRLDEYIFRRVCEFQKEWKSKGLQIVPISVNISKNTLFRNDIVQHYCKIMESYGIEPHEIQLEVTETLVASTNSMAGLLNSFREKGIKILMDDFGTGYTALSVLNKKCFDTIKIDKSLIDGISDPNGAQLIESVTEMIRKLGYTITAEGVEEEYQLKFLQTVNCDDIQGYYFSKPEPAESFEKRLENPYFNA